MDPRASGQGEERISNSGRGFGAVPSMSAAVLVLTVHRADGCCPELIHGRSGWEHQDQTWDLVSWDSGGLGSAD